MIMSFCELQSSQSIMAIINSCSCIMNMHSVSDRLPLSLAANSSTSLPVVLRSSRRLKMFALKVFNVSNE